MNGRRLFWASGLRIEMRGGEEEEILTDGVMSSRCGGGDVFTFSAQKSSQQERQLTLFCIEVLIACRGPEGTNYEFFSARVGGKRTPEANVPRSKKEPRGRAFGVPVALHGFNRRPQVLQ